MKKSARLLALVDLSGRPNRADQAPPGQVTDIFGKPIRDAYTTLVRIPPSLQNKAPLPERDVSIGPNGML